MDKIILADTTAIESQAGAGISKIVTVCTDWEAVSALMQKLTKENLTKVQIETGSGTVVGNYSGLVMQPGAYEVKTDGIYITISLREKTDEEKRIEALEETVDTLTTAALEGGLNA